jgi:metallo-beta-lactamase class B
MLSHRHSLIWTALLCLCAAGAGVRAQTTVTPPTYASVPSFPNAITADVQKHLNAARILAGNDLREHYNRSCIYDQVYPMYSATSHNPYLLAPQQVFDNVYWIGQGAVSAWAVKTSAGLVIIDSLNNASEAQTILISGLKTLGLNPSDIRYLILTNEKPDHVGGAQYLQQTYGATVIASAATWSALSSVSGAPAQNQTVTDAQTLTLGSTAFTFTLTPGTTPGAMTLIFQVVDHGTVRTAALHSGLSVPDSVADKMTYLDSIDHFAAVSQPAGVNTLLSAYAVEDLGLNGMDLLRHRRAANRSPRSASDYVDPNNYVMTVESYQRFLQILSECARTTAARSGQVLPR